MPRNLGLPMLNKARAGNLSRRDVKTDAIGRRVLRVDQERQQLPNYKQQGGTPQARGPETFIPFLLGAAKLGGIDPSKATAPSVLAALTGGNTSQGGLFDLSPEEFAAYLPETQGRRPSDPRLQALAGLRKMGIG